MTTASLAARFKRLGLLRRDRSGIALIEFGYVMPVVLTLGMSGIEVANLAIVNLKVSQIALNLADNASRVGLSSALSQKQLREVDINDVLTAARLQGDAIDVVERGRIILSSLQVNADGGQWIKWQRCLGLRHYDSSYGVTDDGKIGTAFPGMGPTGKEVKSPADSAVMFVEVTYDYRPVLASWLIPARKVAYSYAFIVRDSRDLTKIYNPNPAQVASTCDKYTT